MLSVKNITIEGPDLSGKTTLFNMIHEKTSFMWNIQDRSQLSMLCYARQYERGADVIELWRHRLNEYLYDLNNRLIVLLPSLSVINKRYTERGDEIQDIDSLYTLYEIFTDEVQKIENYPNVLILRGDGSNDLTSRAVEWISISSLYTMSAISNEVVKIVDTSSSREISPLRFELTIKDPNVQDLSDPKILLHKDEEVYYTNILHKVLKNVKDEIAGNNEYNVPQAPHTTRRFIFAQDSCISLIHTMLRGETLEMNVVCRSSDVVKTFPYDLKFLGYLFYRVNRRLNVTNIKNFKIRVTLNSAHMIE
jgi:hypothetical protein